MNSRDTLITELNVLENFDPVVPNDYQDSDYFNALKSQSACPKYSYRKA